MRFESLHVAHFGALTAGGPRAFELGPINVVYGPNEAGKSTFAAAIETLLFGFDPANRETHPLSVWDGQASNLDLTAVCVDRDGGREAIQRVLQASQKLFTAELEGDAALADVTIGRKHRTGDLPYVQGVQRKLYRALWHLELGDFQAFEDAVQKDIDNLILPSVEGLALVPTREALSTLDEDAKQLWRKGNRGSSVAKKLQAEIKDVRAEIGVAKARVEALREAIERRPEVDARLEAIEVELERSAVAAREVRAEEEVAALLAREAGAGREVASVGSADDVVEDPRALLRQREELFERRLRPVERGRRAPVEAEARARGLVEGAATWRAAGAEARELAGAAARLREERVELELGRAALGAELGKVRGEEAGERAFEWLAGLSLDGLDAGLGMWRAARQRPVFVERHWWPFAAGVLLMLVGLVLAQPYSYFAGVLGAGLVLGELVVRRRAALAVDGEAPMPAALAALLEGEVAAAFLMDPEGVERLRGRLAPLAERSEELRAKGSRLDARAADAAERWARLGERGGELGLEAVELERAAGWADALEERLTWAHAQVDAAEQDARERTANDERLAELDAELARTTERLRALATSLAAFMGNDEDDEATFAALPGAFQAWRRAREERVALDEARKGLAARVVEAGFDFEALAERAGDVDPEARAEARGRATAERARLEEERKALLEERGELTQVLKGVESEAGVAELADRERELEEEVAAATRRHDRLRLLGVLLAEADRAWRADHEPDVLKRAGEHLCAFTGGRYVRLGTDEVGGQRRLEVFDPAGNVRPVDAPLSRGTRDQVHLALRLALIDHLDEGGERLPLVLDEVLVHWDAERRAQLHAALAEVAKTRQVFVMTCHAPFAREAAEALGVESITLNANLKNSTR